jgi:sortase A
VTEPSGDGEPRASARAKRPSVIGILGELLMTAGVVVLLYVGWQLWLGDIIYGAQANAESREIAEDWQQEFAQTTPSPAEPQATPEPEATVEPAVIPEPQGTEDFAVMHIPRFGPDYMFTVAGGVTRSETLDRQRIGHYPGSNMPGEVGNFALAAHRTTYGAPFNRIAELRVGDAIVVETEGGWYTYRFRTLEYVTPSEVEVLLPVPQQPGVPADERYITLTSCSPMYSMTERIVAYGVFEEYTPRGSAPPTSLAPPA